MTSSVVMRQQLANSAQASFSALGLCKRAATISNPSTFQHSIVGYAILNLITFLRKVETTEQPQRGCGVRGLQPPALVASVPGHNPVGVATAASADLGLLVPRNPRLCDRTPSAFCWRDYPDASVFRSLRERVQCLNAPAGDLPGTFRSGMLFADAFLVLFVKWMTLLRPRWQR
jgi:hypothetical protein